MGSPYRVRGRLGGSGRCMGRAGFPTPTLDGRGRGGGWVPAPGPTVGSRGTTVGRTRGWVPVLDGNDGEGDGFPLSEGGSPHQVPVRRGQRAGNTWVGSRTGTTVGEGETAGGRERDWGCGILWGVAWECRFAGFWVCIRLHGRLAGVFFAGVAARVGGLHAGAARAVSRPFGPAAVFLSPP